MLRPITCACAQAPCVYAQSGWPKKTGVRLRGCSSGDMPYRFRNTLLKWDRLLKPASMAISVTVR